MSATAVKPQSTTSAPRRCLRAGYSAPMPDPHSTHGYKRNTLLARNVRELRDAIGWTQEQLAVRAGVTNIKMIEAGRRHPRPENQIKIAKALGVPVWRLHVDKSGDAVVPRELMQLMESPIGKGVNPEEYDYLLALPSMLGRRLTYEGYWKALEMLRLSSPDPDMTPPDDDPGDED